jgi:hypothetical protein
MSKYARAKKAFGFCDKTGFRYLLKDLVYEIKDGVKTGFRVGKDVVDPDHPQNFLGRVRINDPQALRDPRPDRFTESALFKYPALNEETLNTYGPPDALITSAGQVTVSIT